MVLRMARVPAGSTVEMTFTFQIERSRILAPDQTDDLVIPKRPDRDLRIYTGNSPYIDSSNARIKNASREIAGIEVENDWARVEQIYDYVRDHVDYVEGPLKNASQALRDGKGDCEEMTSLFVAMCRNNAHSSSHGLDPRPLLSRILSRRCRRQWLLVPVPSGGDTTIRTHG